MKKLFGMLAIFATIYLTSMLFPSLVQVESWKLALGISFVMVLGENLLAIAMIAFLLPAIIAAAKFDSISIAVVSIILTLVVGIIFYPIALYIASKYIAGFQVMSKMGYIVLSFAMLVFTSNNSSSKEESQSV